MAKVSRYNGIDYFQNDYQSEEELNLLPEKVRKGIIESREREARSNEVKTIEPVEPAELLSDVQVTDSDDEI